MGRNGVAVSEGKVIPAKLWGEEYYVEGKPVTLPMNVMGKERTGRTVQVLVLDEVLVAERGMLLSRASSRSK